MKNTKELGRRRDESHGAVVVSEISEIIEGRGQLSQPGVCCAN
jgi:hypothetical protein